MSNDPVAMHRRGKVVLSIRHINQYVHFGLTCDGVMLLNELYLYLANDAVRAGPGTELWTEGDCMSRFVSMM